MWKWITLRPSPHSPLLLHSTLPLRQTIPLLQKTLPLLQNSLLWLQSLQSTILRPRFLLHLLDDEQELKQVDDLIIISANLFEELDELHRRTRLRWWRIEGRWSEERWKSCCWWTRSSRGYWDVLLWSSLYKAMMTMRIRCTNEIVILVAKLLEERN